MPAKPEEQKKTEQIHLHMTTKQKTILLDHVQSLGMPLATWARMTLLEAARKK